MSFSASGRSSSSHAVSVGPFWAVFFHLGTPLPSTDMIPSSRSALCWWPWPQIIDQAQDFPKRVMRYGDFHHLEHDVGTMADNLGPNLDQLLPQRGQRPVPHFLR